METRGYTGLYHRFVSYFHFHIWTWGTVRSCSFRSMASFFALQQRRKYRAENISNFFSCYNSSTKAYLCRNCGSDISPKCVKWYVSLPNLPSSYQYRTFNPCLIFLRIRKAERGRESREIYDNNRILFAQKLQSLYPGPSNAVIADQQCQNTCSKANNWSGSCSGKT